MVLRSSIDLTKWSNLKCDLTEFNRVAIMLKSLVQQDYSETSVRRCSLEKVFCKYAANLQENTHALTLYWNHTSARVFSCKFAACFAEHLFLTTSLGGCFWLFKLVFMIYCFIRLPIMQYRLSIVRSSHQRCSVRKGALRNFAKFTGKTCARLTMNSYYWRWSICLRTVNTAVEFCALILFMSELLYQ